LGFSTYANYWIKKFIRLYLEELIGVMPRTGDMGIEEQGEWECGPWVVDKPRRSVIDLLNAALSQQRVYRGKAAGGMAMFDGPITIPGPNKNDKEIETVGTNGQTNPERLDYLQRRVGLKDFPWNDMLYSEPLRPLTLARFKQVMETRRRFGIRRKPRTPSRIPSFHLPGHAGGKASDEPAGHESTYELDDSLALPPERVPYDHTGPHALQGVTTAEICYLDEQCGSFNSQENFGAKKVHKLAFRHVDYRGRLLDVPIRIGHRLWRKPTCEEVIWYAALAALTETGNERENEFRITAGTCRARGGDCTLAHDKSQRVFAAGFTGEAGA
jgi:hypothetical protein